MVTETLILNHLFSLISWFVLINPSMTKIAHSYVNSDSSLDKTNALEIQDKLKNTPRDSYDTDINTSFCLTNFSIESNLKNDKKMCCIELL